jgi:hypothetical protein
MRGEYNGINWNLILTNYEDEDRQWNFLE